MHLKTHFSISEPIFIYIMNKSNLHLSLLFAIFLLFYTFIRSHLAEDNCRERGFTFPERLGVESGQTRREKKRVALVPLCNCDCERVASGGTKEYISILFHRFVLAPIPPGLLAHDESFFPLLCDSFLNLPIQRGLLHYSVPFKNKLYIFHINRSMYRSIFKSNF